MKNILIVMTSLYNGGAERSLVNFLNEIPEGKYNIDLLLFKKKGMFLSQIPNHINVLDVPSDIKKLYGTLKDAKEKLPIKIFGNIISRIAKKNDAARRSFRWKYFYEKSIQNIEKEYDIAIAYISGEVLYYVGKKVKADKKFVWVHNDYKSANYCKKFEYEYFKKMNKIISISDSCVKILKEEFPEFSDKIYTLENITSSIVVKNRANEFYPIEFQNDSYKLLSIGRLNEQKGFDIAIESAKKLKEKNIDFKWYIIGTGSLRKKLEKQIKNYDLDNTVLLLGSRENPYPYIKNCTIFVQPSRFEGKSVVLDEAKILAKPIIVTNYPTVHDQIISNVEGIISELNSLDLSKTIERVLVDENIRNNLSNSLKGKDYGNQSEINKYIKLIDE